MTNLIWLPSLSPYILISIGSLCVILGAYGLWRHVRGLIWRTLAALIIVIWLAHPQLTRPTYQIQPQDILLILDHSPSISIGDRQKILEQAAELLKKEAGTHANLHIHEINISGGHGQGTHIFETLEQEIPNYTHLSAIFLLTDGQNHDTPETLPKIFHDNTHHPIPIHLLLSAPKEEFDRRLHILNAPPYVMIGQKAHIRLQVDDTGIPPGQPVDIIERKKDGTSSLITSTISGKIVEFDVPITQPGQTLEELVASPLPHEASLENNNAVLHIQGVRDRLKVLLVSGKPNQAARVWRQLLKADPSVDLIHFVILRSPETNDDTPQSDLALIPFPTHELFEQKINNFNLIILDSFSNQNILPNSYLENINNYVQKGGGLLIVSGPEISEEDSLQETPLNSILPAHIAPNGVMVKSFIPQLTKLGLQHPVTAPLIDPPFTQKGLKWGAWYRALKTDHLDGETLLQTENGTPLLQLDHKGKGRVAMLLSDQIWLWSRSTSEAGPQAELLRRLSHWLMKEPDLEENRLEAKIENNTLIIKRYGAYQAHSLEASIITPSHKKFSLTLTPYGTHGVLRGTYPLSAQQNDDMGIWTVKNDQLTAFTSLPEINPLENSDLRTTATKLKPIIEQSKGGIFWLGTAQNMTVPHMRQVSSNQNTYGKDWVGIPLQKASIAGKDHFISLLPNWITLIIILGFLALGWRKEGR